MSNNPDGSGNDDGRLCEICKCLEESLPLQYGLPLLTIVQQAAAGCAICQIISDAVLTVGDDEGGFEDLLVGWDTTRIRGCRIVVGDAGSRQFLYGVDVYGTSDGDQMPFRAAEDAEQALEVSGNTGSNAAITTIQQWIQNCAKHHSCQECVNPRLPKRLLDVSNLDRIFLHCSEPGETGSYACLSHCWGVFQTLRTTASNISDHESGISWDTLPRIFQDAVTVTSRLGIQYLWIDSLCIIQDSAQDWQSESVKMADIYANSTVTIAASLAAGDDESIFAATPDAHISRPIETELFGTINVRRTLSHGHGPQPLPLMRRAWVLQERLLSPRVIHFTREELVWECMEKTTCECGCIRSLWSPGHVPFDKDLLWDRVLGSASRADVRSRWRVLVEEYSRLELSLDRDRLPAVSGAARRIAVALRCRYLAGLWGDRLVSEMLWERKIPSKSPRRLESLPSWSWASIGTEVVYEACRAVEDLAVILEADCDLVDNTDEFGEVLGGTICMSATLLPIAVLSQEHHGQEHTIRLDGTSEGELRGQVVLDDADSSDGSGFFCARMAWRREVYNGGSDQEIWLLLLCIDAGRQVYRRSGLIKTSGVEWTHDTLPEPRVFTII